MFDTNFVGAQLVDMFEEVVRDMLICKLLVNNLTTQEVRGERQDR